MIVDQIEPSLGEVIIVNYEGEYNPDNGTFEGNASAVLDNDCKYDGMFKNGMFHGKGIFQWPKGVKFEGDFEAGQIIGKGAYEWSDGSTYQGDVYKGMRNGTGKFVGSSGQVYEGEWVNGKRHGKGKVYYNEDRTVSYVGDWKANLRHGYGIMKYASGNSYEGEWVADKKCGSGLMVWRDVDEIYTGQWANDLPHGLGEHVWGDSASHSVKKETCNIYRGHFNQGRREGQGTFFFMNGSQYTGEWAKDLKQGEGLFLYADGRIFGGLFHQNRMITDFAKEESSAPRTTEAVNPQFKLNIRDVFDYFPSLLHGASGNSGKTGPTGAVKISAVPDKGAQSVADKVEKETREMERLLLKYNHYIRLALRRYTDFANKRRLRDTLQQHQLLSAWVPTDVASRVHKACATARIFQKRLFCMNTEQTLRFLRECGIVGPYFRSYDLTQCMLQMRDEKENACVAKLREYRRQMKIAVRDKALASQSRPLSAKSVSTETKSEGATTPAESEEDVDLLETEEEFARCMSLSVTSLMDAYLHPSARYPSFQTLACQPLLEKDFVELFVRAIAVKYARCGGIAAFLATENVKGMSLTQLLYFVLAQKLLPLVSDFEENVNAFYRDFYFEEVQTLLYSNEVPTSHTRSNSLEDYVPHLPAAVAAAAVEGNGDGNESQVTFFEKLWLHLKALAKLPEETAVPPESLIVAGSPLSRMHLRGPPTLATNPTGGSIQLQQLLQFLLSQKGVMVDPETTLFTLLMAMECAPASPTASVAAASPAIPTTTSGDGAADDAGAAQTEPAASPRPRDFDMTCVCMLIDFHDFLELFCKVVCSHLWAYQHSGADLHLAGNGSLGESTSAHEDHHSRKHSPHGAEPSLQVESAKAGEGDEDASVFSVSIADILSERLGLLKQTFAVDSLFAGDGKIVGQQ